MNKLRKIFAAGVIFVTVLSMSVVVAPNAGAAAKAGDLIKMNGLSSVYYLAADGKRYVFPNEKTYFSWYKDFSSVVTISQSELEALPLGANVTMRPGTKLVKITTSPNVYAVEPGGSLRKITSETQAKTLYGDNWAKRVVDVPDAFFTNYKVGADLESGKFAVGTLIKNSTGADIFYFDGTNYRKIANEAALSANRFDTSYIVTAATAVTASGAEITAAETTLTDTASGAGGTIGAGTGLTVALSSNTAAASTFIKGQAGANLATFNFTASNDGDVKVTSVKLKRIGVSADTDLPAIYLYDGNTRVTDSASVSSGYATFVNSSGIFTVTKGTTKSITVKANMSSNSGQTIGVAINAASDVATNGASVSGSFPATGNTHSVANATLATVDFATAVTPSSDGTPKTQTNFTMWQNAVTVGTRAVNLNYITLRMIGSVNSTDLKNFKLSVDGTQVATAESMDSNGYVSFDLSASPKKLDTGTRTFKLVGDIISGSTKTFSFSLRQATDVVVVDGDYNANVLATRNGTTFSAVTSTAQIIASGSMDVTKAADSASGNVILGGSGVSLGKFTLSATGEAIKIETLTAKVDTSGTTAGITSLRNGALYADGVQVGSTANLTTSGTQYTVNLTVTPGKDVALEVKADIYDTATTSLPVDGNSIQVALVAATGNAQGVNSLVLKNVPDTTNVQGTTLTVKQGSLTLSKTGTFGNQNMVVPQNNAVKIGSYVLGGNATEDVNLSTLDLNFGIASGTDFTSADFSNVYLVYGTETTDARSGASSYSWSINKTLAKNTSLTIDVYAKIGSTITTSAAATTSLSVTGTTASSGKSASAGPTNGQTITAANGSLTAAFDSTPSSALVLAGTAQDIATYKFTATNDSYDISEIVVKFSGTNAGSVIGSVSFKDAAGATIPGSSVMNGTSVTFTPTTAIRVNAGTANVKKITVNTTLGSIGSGAGSTGANIQATIDSYKAKSSGGTNADSTTDYAANSIYVYAGIPTITNVTASETLTGGTQELLRFTVSADAAGSAITWKKMAFAVSKSANLTLATTSLILKKASDNSTVTGTFTAPASLTATGTVTAADVSFVASSEKTINTGSGNAVTYILYADISGSVIAGENVITKMNTVSSFVAPAAYGTVAGTGATFVWSDASDAAHDESTSADWNNDYLIKSLAITKSLTK